MAEDERGRSGAPSPRPRRRNQPLRARPAPGEPRRRQPLRARPAGPTAEPKPKERTTAPVLLSCGEVSIRFGGVQALDAVGVEVRDGEIVGLIGPNGAGKTTLMEVISGFYRPDAGGVTFRGDDLLTRAPGDRADLGIGRTLQNVRLFPYLTVVDNLRIALHRHMSHGVFGDAFSLPPARQEERRILAEAERIVALMGMDAFAEKFASELSYGTLRLLELACMLALQPDLLLLDEPAAGISQKETEALGPLLRRIKEQTGATILMIEHDMPLIMSLADWIYCLDAGANLADGTPEAMQQDDRVVQAYLGTPTEQRKAAAQLRKGVDEDLEAEVLLEMKDIDVFYDKLQVLYEVDFHVRRGERVALLGTNGAGKSTLLKAASRLLPLRGGQVAWKGEDITHRRAEDLVREGISQVPGGRGLFPTLSVLENLRMGGYIHKRPSQVDEGLARAIHYFPWIEGRLRQPAGTLSGGEQQQIAIARSLMVKPELLMIDELSLGLAPIVIERLMEAIQRMHAEEGLTVVLVEQQASFALGYTDRAYFMEKGEVRYEGDAAGLADRPELLRSVFLAGATAGFGGA